jgi:6-phosphogluconolactonase
MAQPVNRKIMQFPSLQKTSEALAKQIAVMIEDNPAGTPFSLALSGGSTPESLYWILARDYGELPWETVHFFWSDERYVPPDDEHSNYRMAREMLLDRIDIPEDNIHPVPTETMDPMSSSHAYEDELVEFFDTSTPHFDLILLGMGSDGHTASMFPHSAVLHEDQRLVMPVQVDAEPERRLTFTFPLINDSRAVFFLVAGEHKADAVCEVLEGDPDIEEYPAAGVQPDNGELFWYLDDEAASELTKSETQSPQKPMWTPGKRQQFGE